MLPMKFAFEGIEFRVVDLTGQHWFFAAEVCRALDLPNVGQALSRLDDDEKNSITSNDGNRGNPNHAIINESGLYTLILRCRAATTPATFAHRFRKWVTAEVLPALRRHGHYGATSPGPDQLVIDKDEYIDLLKAKIEALEGRRRVPFTDAEKTEIARLADLGMTSSAIARRIDRSEGGVASFLRRRRDVAA